MVHWEDVKADAIETLVEFKKHKIGLIGAGIITFMIMMGLLAPVIAPGVADDWEKGHPRWDANPSQAPPVWVDWITRDDYARQQHFQDPEHESRLLNREVGGELKFETYLGPFDENKTITVVHEEEDKELTNETLVVEEREGVENITVNDLSVELVEGESYDFAPTKVSITVSINHTKLADDQNRTIALEILSPGQSQTTQLHEWELQPGENVTDEISHTFRFDGQYGIYLGKQYDSFSIGVGSDVRVDSFDVLEEDGTYLATAQVSNLVDEERTIRMRRDEVIEQENETNYQIRDFEDFTLDPGQSDEIEWSPTIEKDGTYQFIIKDQVKKVVVGQEASVLSTGNRGFELQQEDVQASLTLPDSVTQGEFVKVEVEAENRLTEKQTIVLKVDGEEEMREQIAGAGALYAHEHTFTYDMQADVLPKEIFFDYSGSSNLYRRRTITIERPDSDELQGNSGFLTDGNLTLERIRRGDEIGEFEEDVTVIRRMSIREKIYAQAKAYLKDKYGRGNFTDPGERNINPVETIFGKPNKNWLFGPEPKKGEYKITIQIDAVKLGGEEYGQGALDEADLHIGGAVYGIFGTDRDRRDIFLGWLWGARYGLYAGGIVALTTIFFSTSYGMTSAYYGGWVDELMSRIHEIIMGIPVLPILIIVLEFYSRSINMFVLIYALLMWRGAARVIRARGLQVAQDTYIEAAESLGSGSPRIIFKHMIPQILPYSIAQAALLVPIVIMAEAGMHILGLGDPTIVTWGTILTEARGANATMNWQSSWFWILFPGLGMVLIGFGFISTGMALERIINPEMQQR